MPDIMEQLTDWARRNWPGSAPGPLEVQPMPTEGSTRVFARLADGGRSLVGMAAPDNQPENRAWLHLAKLLRGLGVPAPRLLALDQERGFFLMEDLGRTSLQDAALALDGDAEALARLYDPVLAMLARMQARAAEMLDTAVCFDGAELDPKFLREREAGYFLAEFVEGAGGLAESAWPPGLAEELNELSRRAGEARPRGFVHRDFQSRNIMVEAGRLGLVDFQGGRLGPAQYDLASLLFDPYVELARPLREQLLERYLDLRRREGPFDREAFLDGWPYVALSRVMQALGAFAFLSRRRGRGHFARYAPPALAALARLSARPPLNALLCRGA